MMDIERERVPPERKAARAPLEARVVLVISNLEYGGAQRQVIELANQLNLAGGEAHVCCLSDYVPLAQCLDESARRLHIVAKRGKFDLTVVPRLARLLGKLRADIVHSFLLDAEIAARLAGLLNRRLAVIGSERNTDYKQKLRHTAALRLTGGCFDAIIANSHAGKRFQMRTLGIAPEKLFVVHNGVDAVRFAPRQAGELRRELNIADTAKVVGMFCSFKRQKNHPMYFRMAERVMATEPGTVFLCVGAALHAGLQGSDVYQAEMTAMADSMGLSGALRILGNRDDVVELYNLCDVTVLTSRREGTPNVLLESMACGVPVVATDVADNAVIVADGKVGYVVPYDDDAAMSERVAGLLRDDAHRSTMGSAARDWVSQKFSPAIMMDKTTAVYREILRRRRNHRGT